MSNEVVFLLLVFLSLSTHNPLPENNSQPLRVVGRLAWSPSEALEASKKKERSFSVRHVEHLRLL